jgi:hypothetical protein
VVDATFRVVLLLPLMADTLPPPAASAPAPSTAAPFDESRQDHIPAHTVQLRPWVLLDPHLSRRERYLWGGPVWEQTTDQIPSSEGFAAGYGQSIETRRGVLLVRANVEHGFRFTGGNHLVVGLGQYMGGAGLVLGPIETTVRAGLVLAELHFGHDGFGFGALSPRVDAGAAFTVGPLRIGVRAISEYSWRWTDGPNAFVRGVIFEVALGRVPPLPDMYRLEN